jgi:hypothetical protein
MTLNQLGRSVALQLDTAHRNSVVTDDKSDGNLLMWMAPVVDFDNHAVEVRFNRINSTACRPQHHRNSITDELI